MADLSHFGTLPDGRAVRCIHLANNGMTVRVLDQGARLIEYRKDGHPSVCVASQDLGLLQEHLKYAGPIIGPVLNRITGASAEIDGKTYQFDANQEGRHTLHSGAVAAQNAIWEISEQSSSKVTLRLKLKDGEGGFPGNRILSVRWALEDSGLTLDVVATTDAPTLMNPGHHGIWNADGTPTWDGQVLTVPAKTYLPVDDETLPTGEIAAVDGTPYDHRVARTPDPALDHNFCFETGFKLLARLDGTTGQSLEVHSDAPGLQAYAGGREGIALEPQLWPDAPKNPQFPSILLTPGETFRQKSRFLILNA